MTTMHVEQPMALRPSRGGEVLRRLIARSGPLLRHLAGRRFFTIWAVIRYRGRRSGKEYALPIAIAATPDGFVIPMPFGSAQWPQNVLAEGGATVHWKGRDYVGSDPVVLGAEGGEAFNAFERGGLKLFGIHRFMQLRVEEFARA